MSRKLTGSEKSIFSAIRENHSKSLMTVILNTVIINILTFISPIYMLQIYDRILPSRSTESLIALSLLAVLLYICNGLFETSRTALLKRLSISLEKDLKLKALSVVFSTSESGGLGSKSTLSDIKTLKKFTGSSSLETLLDAIFIPIFIVALFYVHWVLGWLSVVAFIFFVSLVAVEYRSSKNKVKFQDEKVKHKKLDSSVMSDVGTAISLGMKRQLSAKITEQAEFSSAEDLATEDNTNIYMKISSTFKDVFSISIISVGVVLAINEQISAGLMIVISILVNRAMQPFSKIVTIRPKLQQAKRAYNNLQIGLYEQPTKDGSNMVCDVKGLLELKDVTAMSVNRQGAIIRNMSLQLGPGDLLYITGDAGSGKSTLLKLIAGIEREKMGAVLYDNVPIWNWNRCHLGRNIGYVPQFVVLYPGTIKENISRFLNADLNEVIRVAQLAGVHEYVCRLESGYETYIHENMYFSPSIRKKLALARALYGDPQYVLLDSVETDLGNFDRSQLVQCVQKLKDENKTIVIVSENKMFGVAETLSLNLPSGKPVHGMKYPKKNNAVLEAT